MRGLYLLGCLYLGASGALWLTEPTHPAPTPAEAPPPRAPTAELSALPYGSETAKAWFLAAKPYCNAVEVTQHLAQRPPPSGWDGAGYAAACYALAGRIEDARRVLSGPEAAPNRGYATAIVFALGHPVADNGDDVAAGPIMELVLEFWPDNYQALYHAGMSEYALGQHERATEHLTQFRNLYRANDYFTQSAMSALARMADGLGPERPHPGAHP